jgi:hypothetical protein
VTAHYANLFVATVFILVAQYAPEHGNRLLWSFGVLQACISLLLIGIVIGDKTGPKR